MHLSLEVACWQGWPPPCWQRSLANFPWFSMESSRWAPRRDFLPWVKGLKCTEILVLGGDWKFQLDSLCNPCSGEDYVGQGGTDAFSWWISTSFPRNIVLFCDTGTNFALQQRSPWAGWSPWVNLHHWWLCPHFNLGNTCILLWWIGTSKHAIIFLDVIYHIFAKVLSTFL